MENLVRWLGNVMGAVTLAVHGGGQGTEGQGSEKAADRETVATILGLFYISVIGIVVFVGLTAYDTQNIKEQYSENYDQESNQKLAVFGALSLYLNFVNIFQLLLNFTGERE